MNREKSRSWGGLPKPNSVAKGSRVQSSSNFSAEKSDESEEGVEIPPSSPGTPPKKVWELKFRHFRQQQSPRRGVAFPSATSTSAATSPSSLDLRSFIPPRHVVLQQQQQQGVGSQSMAPLVLMRNTSKSYPPAPPSGPHHPLDNPPPGSLSSSSHSRSPKIHPQAENNQGGEESSVRGGKLFSQMFRKTSSGSHQDMSGSGRGNQRSPITTNELDVPLRRGVEKSYSPKSASLSSSASSPSNFANVHLPPKLAASPPCSLDERILAPSLYRSFPSLGQGPSPSSVRIDESLGWSHSAFDEASKPSELDTHSSRAIPVPSTQPARPLSEFQSHNRGFASTEDLTGEQLANAEIDSLDVVRKKKFTEFHNAHDSNSPFLGDDDQEFQYRSAALFAQVPRTKVGFAMAPSSLAAIKQQASKLTPSPENIEITDERVLRPFEGVDQWKVGRRYLIAPAALVACPLEISAPFILSSKQPLLPTEAASLDIAFGDRCIVLGNCLLSYSLKGNASITAKTWSRASLVIRQNYLLEFDQNLNDDFKGEPRGYAHLEGALARPHPDFSDALELDFFGSPCFKADSRSLVIRLADRSKQRDACVECLNRAAKLNLSDMYWIDDSSQVLGEGSYSYVRRAYMRDSNESVALKIFDKAVFWNLVQKGRERADTLVRETSVQATLTACCRDVDSALRLRGFFETSSHLVMELDLLGGTDLFQYICSKQGALPECEAAQILADVLKFLIAMNSIGAAHRDIKPANVLMCDGVSSSSVRVKVCDFGMSTFVGVDGKLRGRCGTPGYVAPEIFTTDLHGGYGNNVDVYSAGVTLYIMLCGYEPFYGETDEQLVEANRKSNVEFPEEEWRNVSGDGRDLVRMLMERDPTKRPSAREAILHPWFKKYLTVEVPHTHGLPSMPHTKRIADNGNCLIV